MRWFIVRCVFVLTVSLSLYKVIIKSSTTDGTTFITQSRSCTHRCGILTLNTGSLRSYLHGGAQIMVDQATSEVCRFRAEEQQQQLVYTTNTNTSSSAPHQMGQYWWFGIERIGIPWHYGVLIFT